MLDTAIEAARAASSLSLKYFKNLPKIKYKVDLSPVTIADKTTENVIRAIISRKYPTHGIIGEEHPPINPDSQYQWIIDPIDGTKQFIKHLPVWANFIGLMKDNEPILGIINYPCFSETYIAQKGKGAYLNGKRVRVSKTKKVSEAYLAHGWIKRMGNHNVMPGFLKLNRMIYSAINLGPYSIGELIRGNIDINIDGGGNVWDFVAPCIIVEEAGGKFTDFSGKRTFSSSNAIMTNGILHSEVVKILNSKK